VTAAFDFDPRTRLVFGLDAVDRVGALARELGGHRVLVVTDPGIVLAGHALRVEHSLQAAGLGVVVFDKVRENPTTKDVDHCLEVARAAAADLIVGLGGGSAMDTAKGCNFLLTNGGRMRDYWGYGKAQRPMLPLIAIPTTAGTGSECQCAALIADEDTHQKMACLDPKAAARVALLDPRLTLSLPPRVTACSGIDAIAHAVETAVTKKRTPLSMMFSQEAFRLLVPAFPKVLAQPSATEARADMLLGASLAGAAIENSMLGAAHAAANPLTAHFNVTHGLAVGLLLPHVVRFNAKEPHARAAYLELGAAAGLNPHPVDEWLSIESLASLLSSLLDQTQLPACLADCGVKHAALPALAQEACRQWTAGFNPRPVAAPDFEHVYAQAFERRR
jgi:alcohol dehydrogenase